MKLSDLFAKMVTNETLANIDILEFDSRTTDTQNTNSQDTSDNTSNTTNNNKTTIGGITYNMEEIAKQNMELHNRIKELEKANQNLMSGISLEEEEKAIEERIYDLCVPGHKKEVYNR